MAKIRYATDGSLCVQSEHADLKFQSKHTPDFSELEENPIFEFEIGGNGYLLDIGPQAPSRRPIVISDDGDQEAESALIEADDSRRENPYPLRWYRQAERNEEESTGPARRPCCGSKSCCPLNIHDYGTGGQRILRRLIGTPCCNC